MKLAAAIPPRQGEPWHALAARAAALGFTGLSLPFDPAWTDADLMAIRAALGRHGVEIVELAAHCNFLTPSDREARRNLATLARAMEAGALLNCDHVVTHAGTRRPGTGRHTAPHPDNWADATWDLLVQRIWALLDAVQDLGVRLCFEPCPTTTLNTLDSLAALTADVTSVRVAVALDPAAIFSPQAAANSRQALAETFAVLADTIALARATDVRLVGTTDEPLLERVAPGEGVLHYPTYVKLINALELDTPIVVPAQPSDAAYRKARGFLASAAARAARP